MAINKAQMTQKWSPVVENIFTINNSTIKTLICCYCEWITTQSNNSVSRDLSNDVASNVNDMIKLLLANIDESDDSRVEIVGKFFNVFTGNVEYKLANGEYVLAERNPKYQTENLGIDRLISVFGTGFVSEMYPEEYTSFFRENQLNRIL